MEELAERSPGKVSDAETVILKGQELWGRALECLVVSPVHPLGSDATFRLAYNERLRFVDMYGDD